MHQQINLTNCDKELIHIPGAIQPHGVLFVLTDPELKVVQISSNAVKIFALEIENFFHLQISALFSKKDIAKLRKFLLNRNSNKHDFIRISTFVNGKKCTWNGIAHRYLNHLIFEIEPLMTHETIDLSNFYNLLKASMAIFQDSKTLVELAQNVVNQVQKITAFDRIVIYRFDEQWNGRVIAEAIVPNVESYDGLHFPASDIPEQARKLYALNRMRYIPEVFYQPSQLVVSPSELQYSPLDLSFSILRSVSPIHIEYLKNMQCKSSMSISLIVEGKLWGLISLTNIHKCGYLPYEIRVLCDLLSEIMESHISAKEANEGADERLNIKNTHALLLENMTKEENFITGLLEGKPNILNLVNAHGAAIYFNGKYTVIGQAPNDNELAQLIQWLASRPHEDVFVTDSLSSIYPPAENFKYVASGIMAISLSRGHNNYVLLFRPEVTQTVNWGGNPQKIFSEEESGTIRLHPRKSFHLWKEIVKKKSNPWSIHEIAAGHDLRKSIIDVVLQRTEDLQKLNVELKRSNNELDSFAYAASHDLKEPLRGIHNFTTLVLREFGNTLKSTAHHRLERVIELTQRMENLIDSLLHYSQVGRLELTMRELNLNHIVIKCIQLLKHRLVEENAKVTVKNNLPSIRGDGIRISEVFTNLITNAIKYNDKEFKIIKVGSLESNNGISPIFYVQDNGIGIPLNLQGSIFKIFKRLHARDKFGGGNGTGLTITKSIVERHNGKIWLESEVGKGTTFYFTFGPSPEQMDIE